MPNENQEQLTPAEQVELQRRFPRIAYWVGAAARHPDIHCDDPQQNVPEGDARRIHNITVSFPLNTGIVGGIITRDELVLEANISFVDFLSRLCAKMDVNPQVTVLGYKFNRDPHCTKYTPLTDEEDLHAAMACGVELIRQARTRRVVLEIENLQPACQAAMASISRKRAADEIESTMPRSGDMQKKVKTAAFSGASASSASNININIGGYIPLGDCGGQRRINTPALSPANRPLAITFSSSPPSSPGTRLSSNSPPCDYPTIDAALRELHNSVPYFNLPQYASALSHHGVATVEDVRNVSDETLVKAGLPPAVLDMFRRHAAGLALMSEGHGVSAPRD